MGLVMLDAAGTWHRFGRGEGLPAGLVWPYLAPDGTVWLAAEGALFRVDGDRIVAAHALPDSGHVTTMLVDRSGALWVGTENRGIARIDGRGADWLPPGGVLPRGRVASLLEDAEGSIWVGANGGLFRLRETLFTGFTRRDGLASDYVRAVLEDRDGVLWVGNGGGLDRQSGDGRFDHVALPGAGGEEPSVLSLAEGTTGDLWVGTFADGVYRVRGDGLLRHYTQADGLPGGHVRAIGVTADGTVWIGSRRGVVRIDAEAGAGGVQPPPAVPGLPQGLVTALAGIGADCGSARWRAPACCVATGSRRSTWTRPAAARARCSGSARWTMRYGSPPIAACTATAMDGSRAWDWSRACRWMRCSSWSPTARAKPG